MDRQDSRDAASVAPADDPQASDTITLDYSVKDGE